MWNIREDATAAGGGEVGVPPLGDAMRAAGIEGIEMYISRRKNMVAQYIATHSILRIFLDKGRRPGLWVPKRWW